MYAPLTMEPSCTIATTANRSRLSLQPVRRELPVSNAHQSISHKDPIDDTEVDGMTPEVPPLLYLLSLLSVCKVLAHAWGSKIFSVTLCCDAFQTLQVQRCQSPWRWMEMQAAHMP